MPLTRLEDVVLVLVALPCAAAPISYVLDRAFRPARDWLVILALAANLALACGVGLAGWGSARIIPLAGQAVEGLPAGVSVAVSGPCLVALPLVASVCLAVGVYSIGYVQPGRFVGGYYAFVLLAAGALDVIALAGDLVTLSAGLALLGVVLSALVGLDFARGAGAAATKVLLMLEMSAVLVFASAWLVLARGGSIALDRLLAANAALGDWLPSAAGLLLVGLATGSALAPLHTWLTSSARQALAPVMALLAGGVLPATSAVWLRVLEPSVELTPTWPVLALLGALSVLIGALGALRSASFLPFLAFQAVGQGGFVALALAQGSAAGRAAAVYQLATLALLCTLVVLGVGAVLQMTKSVALVDFLRLRASRPAAAFAALIGAAGIAALPPWPGYWSRAWLLQALLQAGGCHLPLVLVVLLGSALLTASLLRLVGTDVPVAGEPAQRQRLTLLAPLFGLGALGSLAAFVPPDLVFLLIAAAPAETAPTPGLLAPLLLLAALSLGIALRLAELSLLPPGPRAAFDRVARRLGSSGPLVARVEKRVRPEWLDVYAAAGGLLLLGASAAAALLDRTLGRLGRNA